MPKNDYRLPVTLSPDGKYACKCCGIRFDWSRLDGHPLLLLGRLRGALSRGVLAVRRDLPAATERPGQTPPRLLDGMRDASAQRGAASG